MMRSARNLLCGLLVAGSVLGVLTLVEMRPSRTAFAQPAVVVEDNWRYHDGRWSFWNQTDKRWYYTDGQHWYYHDGKVWSPYRFDRAFGRRFERGVYEAPGAGVTVTAPNHRVYVGP